MTTLDKIEEYLESLEERMFNTIAAANLPNVNDALHSLWTDITRYGPDIPKFPPVHIPGLGDFEVPAPPPNVPPRPPPSTLERLGGWVERNPRKTAAITVGVVGTSLLAGYGGVYMRARRTRKLKEQTKGRRQVVVVLGGDTAMGHPLIQDLERKGFIVIASVATPSAAELLESRSHGYVRALVLDPTMPDTIPVFLRSLSSALGRKFPLNASGDPFAVTPAFVVSIISLLTLPSYTLQAPVENIPFSQDYLAYLTATQITPLTIIQQLLPMLRVPSHGQKNIVVCLPSTSVRVGLPFDSVQSMSAVGTLRAVEVLRREIHAAALTGKSEYMKSINLVVVDVGAFDVRAVASPGDTYKSMENWTSSEKLIYGPAFAAIIQHHPDDANVKALYSDRAYGVPRKPTDVGVFVHSVVSVVGNGRFGPKLLGFDIGLGKLRNWLRGQRFEVGAGASTYKFASILPPILLDTLLNIPHFLIGLRNRLLPAEPFVRPRPADSMPTIPRQPTETSISARASGHSQSESEHSESSGYEGSEADVESNSGEVLPSTVESSWVSLNNAEDTSPET